MHCEIDMCSPNPCQNGGICTVKDGGTNYSCTCLVDITGRNCELQHLSGWSSWTAWKPCDCGRVNRTRSCQIDPCVGPSFDQKDCTYPTIMTEKGKCAFPFIYKGVCYDACTDFGHSTEWCSLNKIYRSYQWGNCP
ncbi:adhesive plaque matrix protein 2-like [Exaiptasia diaphana]|uniref:EGF-like domain-containing protein n=1 Tax=Exaiptasia diaphana TaxID=2652724 RepID=A0A913WVP7_EXADI|nr:adhesive plaque matrix protein 2-like [Exaiptasia diaphana]